MNTPNGLSIQAVTEVTGLSRARIYQAEEVAALGLPAHFSYVGGGVVYTAAGLCQLVGALDSLGETVAAKALAVAIKGLPASEVATGAASPSVDVTKLRGTVGVGSQDVALPPRVDWAARQDAREEEAA